MFHSLHCLLVLAWLLKMGPKVYPETSMTTDTRCVTSKKSKYRDINLFISLLQKKCSVYGVVTHMTTLWSRTLQWNRAFSIYSALSCKILFRRAWNWKEVLICVHMFRCEEYSPTSFLRLSTAKSVESSKSPACTSVCVQWPSVRPSVRVNPHRPSPSRSPQCFETAVNARWLKIGRKLRGLLPGLTSNHCGDSQLHWDWVIQRHSNDPGVQS